MQDSANPKAQPKSATATKATGKDAVKGRKGKTATSQKARPKRSKPKTAEELDAEMTDYFNANNTATATAAPAEAAPANGAIIATAGGDDTGMDEISVSSFDIIV